GPLGGLQLPEEHPATTDHQVREASLRSPRIVGVVAEEPMLGDELPYVGQELLLLHGSFLRVTSRLPEASMCRSAFSKPTPPYAPLWRSYRGVPGTQ